MATPLRWFRRHAKILMVVLGSAAMAIFGLGPVFDTLSRSSGPGSQRENAVIAHWKGGDITRNDLDSMQIRHYQTQRFLVGLQQAAIERKGDEYRPLVQMIAPLREGQKFHQTEIDEQLIGRFILAKKAEEEGLVVSDGVVDDYLAMASGDVGFSRNDLVSINHKSNQGNCSLENIRRHLQMELLAQQMQMYTQTGLQFAPNPVESMEYYGMVSERVECDVLPVSVEQYLSKIDEQATSMELKKLYEEGKYNYPDPSGEKPGFKLRNKVAVQYVKAELETFMQNEMNKLTDEQVQEEYERLVKAEDDLVMEPIPDESDESIKIDVPPPGTDSGDGNSADQNDVPDDVDAPPSDTEAPELEMEVPENQPETSVDKSTESSEAAETSGSESPDNEPSDNESPESESSDDEDSSESSTDESSFDSGDESVDEEDESEKGQSLNIRQNKMQFVSTVINQDDETDEVSESPEQDSTEGESESTDETTDELAEMPSIDNREIKKRARPLIDVAVDVKRSMVRETARKAMEESIKKASATMTGYYTLRMKWEYTSESKRGPEPEPIDYKSMAAKYNLIADEIDLVDEDQLAELPFGQIAMPVAVRMPDGRQQRRFLAVAQLIFDRFDDLKVYDSQTVSDFMSGDNYLYWLSEKVDAKVPEFEACRPVVEKFWKSRKALELAKSEADKIAQQVNDEGKTLREIYGDRVSPTGEFSWFSNFGRTTFGQPLGVEDAGESFMETTFSLQKMAAGAAANSTKDTVYVVQMLSERKTAEELGNDYLENQLFKFKRVPGEVASIAQYYGLKINEEWYLEMADAMELKFFGR